MFVRNNITCPFCGKSRTFDLAVDYADSFDHFILMRAECSFCMGFRSSPCSLQVMTCAVLAATQWRPQRDSLRRCWRWATSYNYTKVYNREKLKRLVFDVYETGLIDWKSADHLTVQVLCASVLIASGSPVVDLRPTWLGSLRDYDANSIVDFSALGQPLAS